MTSPRLSVPLPLLAVLLLGGCAGSVSSFPSLAPRPIEKGQPLADSATPAAPAAVALAPALLARAADLVKQGEAGDAAFATAARGTCGAIDRGRGAATGSEAWVAAQQALSALEAERRATTMALQEADTLVLEQAQQAQGSDKPVDLTPLTSAAATLSALDTAQSARLDSIRGQGCRS